MRFIEYASNRDMDFHKLKKQKAILILKYNHLQHTNDGLPPQSFWSSF